MNRLDSTTELEQPGVFPVVSTEIAVKPTRRKFTAEYPGLARQGRQTENPPGNRPVSTGRRGSGAETGRSVFLPPGRLAQGPGNRAAAGLGASPTRT
jgi:hypothetical protein